MLDTWFSSGLWPFSTLGWPDDTADLRRFYPGSVMETGYDIIFFWVARMIFFGIELMGEPPFHTVYLHGTVRDAEGARMSKTKGNVIDPTEVTAEYGTDALRFALVTQGSPGVDMKLSLQKVEDARNFANKLWNATRFALRPIAEAEIELAADGPARPRGELALADRWILSRLDPVTAEVTRLLEHPPLRRGRAAAARVRLVGVVRLVHRGGQGPAEGNTGRAAGGGADAGVHVWSAAFGCSTPIMPFVTEALWQELPHGGRERDDRALARGRPA